MLRKHLSIAILSIVFGVGLAELIDFNGSWGRLQAAEQTWKVGDRVLALWAPEKYWYPGTIRELKDGTYLVVFDDGDKRWAKAAEVAAEDIKVGDRVYGNFHKAGRYYPGKVTTRVGEQIHILYDDGDQEDATIGAVRVIRPRE